MHPLRFVLLLLLSACVHAPKDASDRAIRVTAESEMAQDAGAPAGTTASSGQEALTPASRDDADGPAPGDALELPPPPGDPRAALYSKRLDFRDGDPVVPIRLMEGQREVIFSPRGRVRVKALGSVDRMLEAPEGSLWRVRVTQARPAEVAFRVQLGEVRFTDKEGLVEAEQQWRARGVKVHVFTLGSVYGIGGKVIDNRSYLLLVDEVFTAPEAARKQTELLQRFGARTHLFEELRRPPSGILELVDANGQVALVAESVLEAQTPQGEPIEVRRVEFGVGYDFHGFEDRAFRGGLRFTVDRSGKLAVVNLVALEDLLKGLVPSEIFARAHVEALKAQAVTARGEVLAKVGTKHLADPYLLCSEQHCAVYRGLTGEVASTNAAVEQTQGQALFSTDGRLVDSVYSAVCGGHTEHNEYVWGGVPNPHLRGRPDFISPDGSEPSPAQLAKFLAGELPAACRLSSFAQPSKYRWERRFSAAEVDALTADLDVGAVRAMSVSERGVSGRARILQISGEQGATQIRGELTIRRRFKMLNSAMFLVNPEHDARGHVVGWTFRGGGWGHGVGMCQTGAIGRAEAGQDYREILRHYYNGAEVSHIHAGAGGTSQAEGPR